MSEIIKNKISIGSITIDEESKKAVMDVLDTGYLVSGKNILELERKFALLCGAKYAIAVTSGTSALHTAISILGIGYGDEVITTPFTYVATANAIVLTGATPVFVDIDPVTYNIDPDMIEKAITSKTKAILVVDLYGLPADYKKIRKIANKYNLKIIEDAAQSVGASYFGKMTGLLGDIGCFSMYATKNLMSGEGGMVVTNSKTLEIKARRFRNHGEYSGVNYSYVGVGHNYCPTDIVGAIGLGQLKHFPSNIARRRTIAIRYSEELKNIDGIVTPRISMGCTHVFHQYTLRLTKEFGCSRDEFQRIMSESGIITRVYYPKSIHHLKHLNPLKRKYNLKIVEEIAKQVISIPVHPNLSDEQVQYIINEIKKISNLNKT